MMYNGVQLCTSIIRHQSTFCYTDIGCPLPNINNERRHGKDNRHTPSLHPSYLNGPAPDALDLPSSAAHDPDRQRLVEPKRVSDSKHFLSDLEDRRSQMSDHGGHDEVKNASRGDVLRGLILPLPVLPNDRSSHNQSGKTPSHNQSG